MQDNAASLDLFGDFPDRLSTSFAPRHSIGGDHEDDSRPNMMRLEPQSKQNIASDPALRKEVARLEAALAELTQENAAQREQVINHI
jgi:hypothetical protein